MTGHTDRLDVWTHQPLKQSGWPHQLFNSVTGLTDCFNVTGHTSRINNVTGHTDSLDGADNTNRLNNVAGHTNCLVMWLVTPTVLM